MNAACRPPMPYRRSCQDDGEERPMTELDSATLERGRGALAVTDALGTTAGVALGRKRAMSRAKFVG